MLNKMLIIGNVGRDPEMRYTPNGNAVTSFSVASGRSYTTRDGERREDTEWFRVVAWDRLAETCNQFVTKGMKVYVEGRLKSSTWVAADGQNRFTNEIIANQVTFLSRPSGGGDGGAPYGAAYGEPAGGGGYSGGGYSGSDGGYGGPPPNESSDADDLPW